MKSDDIMQSLTVGAYAPFHYRRVCVVPNVSWGLLDWEADMIVLQSSGFLTEIEVKISVADLRRDADKKKHAMFFDPRRLVPQRLFYAMPADVAEKAADAVPAHAGIIIVRPCADTSYNRARIVRAAKKNVAARKLTETEKFQLLRLGVMRYWTRKFPQPQKSPCPASHSILTAQPE